jgi:Fe-Mn family superoxide dismutase
LGVPRTRRNARLAAATGAGVMHSGEPSIDPIELRAALDRGGVALLDVRKQPAYASAGRRIVGAVWRDPFAVDDWMASVPGGMPTVVYCVHGHEVSRGVRDALIAGGYDARILRGGYAAWIEAGGATEPNPSH